MQTQASLQTTYSPYDAILLVSFGGPERMDDVLPFLENVLRGRNVPHKRMLAVAEHYYMFGGVSPINAGNRKLIAVLRQELDSNGLQLPIYWGNRNWHPLLEDTMRQMRDDGIKHALAFVTTAYSSYSSCRQYLENIAAAQEALGAGAPRVDKIRAFYNHPDFIQANAENVKTAFKRIPESRRGAAQLIFTAHSIPLSMAQNCRYEVQLMETARLVAAAAEHSSWTLAYQSRSGSLALPWLGPDILDCLQELKESGTTDAVVAPIGFVSDHMEVVYDLDLEAKRVSEEIGLNLVRAATVGTHPVFIRMIRELITERTERKANRRFLGNLGVAQDFCAVDCCQRQAGASPPPDHYS